MATLTLYLLASSDCDALLALISARNKGVAELFMETRPDPANALSDGLNAVPLKHMNALLEQLPALDLVVKRQELLEHNFAV